MLRLQDEKNHGDQRHPDEEIVKLPDANLVIAMLSDEMDGTNHEQYQGGGDNQEMLEGQLGDIAYRREDH